jgi:hypothetical protein
MRACEGGREVIYLCSPYSDPNPAVREQRFQAACAVTAGLLRDGQMVYSPVVHGHPLVRYGLSTDWSFWERHDRLHLERCDEVVVLMLDGWRVSVGLQAELRHASVLGKPVRYLEADGVFDARVSRPIPEQHRGLRCLVCGSDRLRVVYTRDRSGGVVQRRRECRDCKMRATTWERVVPAPTLKTWRNLAIDGAD